VSARDLYLPEHRVVHFPAYGDAIVAFVNAGMLYEVNEQWSNAMAAYRFTTGYMIILVYRRIPFGLSFENARGAIHRTSLMFEV
jgi:hypothetical protein